MEVGAVKQAFNNEVILLKKRLNQAKIQVIHKLTRKAKTFAEKKAPEHLEQKLKRKAESAIKEVLIIKKIKPKDIAKFIVTHKGQLNEYLNRPNVDEDKACARLLLHKSLQDKYKLIRDRFSNVPIQDLFMSRLERRKIKKEAREQQKSKKKGMDTKVVNSEGDWNVEDVEMDGTKDNSDAAVSTNKISLDLNEDSSEENQGSDDEDQDSSNDIQDSDRDIESDASVEANKLQSESDSDNKKDVHVPENVGKSVRAPPKIDKPIARKTNLLTESEKIFEDKESKKILDSEINNTVLSKKVKKIPEKKPKDPNKNKNLKDKIEQKKFKKTSEVPIVENKIVDPFFRTSTGENYLTVVEPRAPDEVKEVHKEGNRKLRRAVMFGLAPKMKSRQNYRNENSYNNQNGFEKGNSFNNKFSNDKFVSNINRKQSFQVKNDRADFNAKFDRNNEGKEEKLHPSWEAKKKQSGILPFKGKKIVFDET